MNEVHKPAPPQQNDVHKVRPTQHLYNPVTVIALLIIVSIFVLFGAAMLGKDNGILKSMAQFEFARGLITYLFAVVTIGTAVVLVVSVLTSPSDSSDEMDKRFQRGKEVLSLLLGLFGTIVGFYFGSQVKSGENVQLMSLRLTPPLLSQYKALSGEKVKLTASVSGGTPPYLFASTIGKDQYLSYNQSVEKNGWIVKEFDAPKVSENKSFDVLIGVKDALGNTMTTSAELEVEPKPGQQ